MQLDKTRIVIRERGWLEILDLSLHVLREYPALLQALAAGAIPAAMLNYWLLSGQLKEIDFTEHVPVRYLYAQWLLTMIEAPIATSFITLYLGQALFMEKPKPRELLSQFWHCLPQLLWFQGLIRGLLGVFVVTWLVPYLCWPYLNEVILLERNPLRSRRGKEISTSRRSSMLHAASNGDFLLWMIGAMILGLLLITSFWLSIWFLRGMLGGTWVFGEIMFTVALPAAQWLVLGYFAVVRYLGYLDLRIRREGWEVELLLRAERARLMQSVA